MVFSFEIEHKLIIEYLFDTKEDFTTSAILANITGYSTKTVTKFINDISEKIIDNGAAITSKRGHGYRLEILDDDLFHRFMDLHILGKHVMHVNDFKQSVHLIIREFLSLGSLKTSHFTDLFYTNRNTVSQMYNEVSLSLEKFKIEMKQLSSRGINLSGSEMDIRSAIVYERYYYLNKTINVEESFESVYCNRDEISKIKKLIIETQEKFNIGFLDDNSLEDLAFHLYVANLRNNNKKLLQFDEEVVSEFLDRNSYYISDALINDVNNKLNYELFDNEKIFASIFLVANRVFLSSRDFPISEDFARVEKFTERIIDYISDVNYFVQIREDEELKMDLSLNISQLITQSKFHLYRPIIIKPSTQSLQAQLIAVQISNYLYNKFAFKLTEWQLYYLTAIIYPVFGRYDFKKKKGRALIVSNVNKFIAKSMCERIERNFVDEFSKIDTFHLYELKNIDLENYEYMFTSYTRAELPKLPKNIIYFYTDMFFDSIQKQKIRAKLLSKSISLNNTILDVMQNIKIKHLNKVRNFDELINEFAKLNENNITNRNLLVSKIKEYAKIADFPCNQNAMFLTPLKSQSLKIYVSIIVVANGLRIKDDKPNIFILWDRGNNESFSSYFENESFANILYNTLSDPAILTSLTKNIDRELFVQKALEVQERIITNGPNIDR